MQCAVVFGNTCRKEVAFYAGKLIETLVSRGVDVLLEREFFEFLRDNETNVEDLVSARNFIDYCDYTADFVFVVGGDGTFIHSANKVGGKNIPMVGINAGRLGFLTDIDGNCIAKMVDDLINQRYKILNRTVLKLHTTAHCKPDFHYALNEIAISKLDSASLITIHTWVNGVFLNSYQADGLLISTPTGSTAYSMSVGGPIMMPDAHGLILSPVAPHSLTMRPLIIPETDVIEMQVESRTNKYLIALDGRCETFDESVQIRINKSSFTIKSVLMEDHNFFNTLRNKLMWGADNRKFLKKGYDDEPDDDAK